MVALDESWPRRVGAIRSITTEVVAGIFVSDFLTSLGSGPIKILAPGRIG
jgi:hypothetical protein